MSVLHDVLLRYHDNRLVLGVDPNKAFLFSASSGLLISSALVQTPSSQSFMICRTVGVLERSKGQVEFFVLTPGLSGYTSIPNLPQPKDGEQDLACCASLSPRITEKQHGSSGPV